jgi:hypothetical protein
VAQGHLSVPDALRVLIFMASEKQILAPKFAAFHLSGQALPPANPPKAGKPLKTHLFLRDWLRSAKYPQSLIPDP